LFDILNWLKQNWKWLLPMAVISAFFPITIFALTSVLLTCLFCVKSSKIYRKTIITVQKNDRVLKLIGSPVKAGLLVMGNISRRTTETMVNMSIPLSGPDGQATVFAVAKRQKKEWCFTTLQVQCRKSGTHIDLLQK